MRKYLDFIPDSEQLAGESRIVEIEFGALDDPFVKVAVVRREEKKMFCLAVSAR